MKNSFGIALLSISTLLAFSVQAQDPPADYTFDEPDVFNEWCQQMKDMFGPTCVCNTTIGNTNGVNALDLDHEVNCDPLQGDKSCIEDVTIESARVWLRATSIGEEGNFQNIQQTVITDLYVFLDETSIDTVSFRYNANFDQRRTGCEAVFGAVNCARCGVCDAPPDDRTDGIHVHLSPNDIFRGISGQCRYGNGPDIGIFNTCNDGDNVLTNIVWKDLEITSEDEKGACPANADPGTSTDAGTENNTPDGSSGSSSSSSSSSSSAVKTTLVATASLVAVGATLLSM